MRRGNRKILDREIDRGDSMKKKQPTAILTNAGGILEPTPG